MYVDRSVDKTKTDAKKQFQVKGVRDDVKPILELKIKCHYLSIKLCIESNFIHHWLNVVSYVGMLKTELELFQLTNRS